jgi:hypothetical protein
MGFFSENSFQGAPPSYAPHNPQPTSFSIHKNKKAKALDIVPFGPAPMGEPMYRAKVSSSKKPNVRLSKNQYEIYTSSDHSFSSKIDIIFNGQPIQMSQSSLSGHCTVHHPKLGDLKWKVPQLFGSAAELIDGRGTRIAALKSNKVKGMGQKTVELYVPCDPVFLDLVIGTALTLMKAVKELQEGVFEVGAAGLELGFIAASG